MTEQQPTINIVGVGTSHSLDQVGINIAHHIQQHNTNLNYIAQYIYVDSPINQLASINFQRPTFFIDGLITKNNNKPIIKLHLSQIINDFHGISSHHIGLIQTLHLYQSLGQLTDGVVVLYGISIETSQPIDKIAQQILQDINDTVSLG